MMLGLSLSNFTILHTVISLVQLVSGLLVVKGLLGSRIDTGWISTYLVTAVLTSVTGFMFPFNGFLPSHAFGILSLVLLALVILALYVFKLDGAWRWVYAIGVVITVYLDAFVAVVQSFLKIPQLHALAPGGSEPPFAIAQGILLIIFIVLGVMAFRGFHPAARPA